MERIQGRRTGVVCTATLVTLSAVGCAEQQPGVVGRGESAGREEIVAQVHGRIASVLDTYVDTVEARTDEIFDTLRPVPLLAPSEQAALRRYLNADHLARARRLGVPLPQDAADLAALERQGRLVQLEDSTEYWVLRDLESSAGLVTPDTYALLTQIGERFQDELEEMGLPPYRFVITSALRTAEGQAALRRTNPNAARGVSTHQFGTTVDIAYSTYAAPTEPVVEIEGDVPPWLASHLRRVEAAMLERVAAQKSREFQAILGRELREMQAEGKVMVTLERQQPVYHITVAERLAGTP